MHEMICVGLNCGADVCIVKRGGRPTVGGLLKGETNCLATMKLMNVSHS